MSSSSASFIDQLLAGQLFVAARAHDSLSEEVNQFLPSSISGLFPATSEHSRKYKSAAYSALVKTQHGEDDSDSDEESVTVEARGSVVLYVLRNLSLQKHITSYLSVNDKVSLIFATSDDNEGEDEEDEEEDGVDEEKGSKAGASEKGLSLSDDLFHRESEDLEIQRNMYLTQLVQTREIEGKIHTLKQTLDRCEYILNNADSADLIRLNYLACKLHLLRDITAKNYEDFFAARGNYASWGLQHLSNFTAITTKALDKARISRENCRSRHEETILSCQKLISDVIEEDLKNVKKMSSGTLLGSSKKKGHEQPTSKGKSRRRASVVVSTPRGMALRAVEEVSEFKEMRRKGLTYLAPYQERIEKFGFIEDDNDDDSDGNDDCPSKNTTEDEVHGDKQVDSIGDESTLKDYVPNEDEMERYRQRVASSLKDFEVELCERLENMTKITLTNIQRKYVRLDKLEDLPSYLKDTKWKIDQKRTLATIGAERIEATKESLALDFENRVERAYKMFLEQQMTKLKRMQAYSNIEASI